MLLLMLPYWFQSDRDVMYQRAEDGLDRKLQALALVVFAGIELCGGIGATLQGIRSLLMRPSGLILSWSFLTTLLFSVCSVTPAASAVYCLATWGCFFLCAVAWYDNHERINSCASILGWLILAYLGILCGTLGWDSGYSTIGGMHHNILGGAFVTSLVLLHLGGKLYPWLGTAICLLGIIASSSRSCLLFAAVFLGAVLLMTPWNTRRLVNAIACVLVAVGAISLASALGFGSADKVVDAVLCLNDSHRGLGSGFTGRTTHWSDGWAAFSQSPLIGYGFRTRAPNVEEQVLPEFINAHSGYVNLLLDVGLVGALPFIGVIVGMFFSRLGEVRQRIRAFRDGHVFDVQTERFQRLDRVVVAFLGATLLSWIIEPQVFNLGTPQSALLIFILVAPRAVVMKLPKRTGRSSTRAAQSGGANRSGSSDAKSRAERKATHVGEVGAKSSSEGAACLVHQ
jgi:O-antigen ligase